METYKNFFHSYRMPHEDMDRLLPQSRRSNHIVVASCDQFFILRLGQDPLDNPYSMDASTLLNESGIYEQLLRIYRVSRENSRRQLAKKELGQPVLPKVGLFTTENRKVWAKIHKKLCHTGDSNSQNGEKLAVCQNLDSLRQIEDCLFVMCLDSLVDDQKGSRTDENKLEQSASIILTGGGSDLYTANRWFDKFLQIIVGRDGICGINIEHSASEGITVLRFLEEFLSFIKSNPINSATNQTSEIALKNSHDIQVNPEAGVKSVTSIDYVEPDSPSALLEESQKITQLTWTLDQELVEALDVAEHKVNTLIDNFSLFILNFECFGRDFIKEQNLSPDAFIQLALQYTFFKLHGHLVSTYESASLRQFRLGRVDNIRANTCEAFEWIQAMLESKDPTSQTDVEQLFLTAMTKQVEILRYTITGSGPDNHLLALKQLAKIRYYDELPELFLDKSYQEFLNFRLSTSQLPNESGITVGYGAVTPDGYGCSYNPCSKRIIFCISSFADCPETDSPKFARTLEESLQEMKELCISRITRSGNMKVKQSKG